MIQILIFLFRARFGPREMNPIKMLIGRKKISGTFLNGTGPITMALPLTVIFFRNFDITSVQGNKDKKKSEEFFVSPPPCTLVMSVAPSPYRFSKKSL